MNKKFLCGIFVLMFSSLACKPVFAIGWNELFFLFLLIAALLGPPLYRFVRRVEGFRKRKQKDQ
jgi:hypothetical protein